MGPIDKQERTGALIGSPNRDRTTRDATGTTDVCQYFGVPATRLQVEWRREEQQRAQARSARPEGWAAGQVTDRASGWGSCLGQNRGLGLME